MKTLEAARTEVSKAQEFAHTVPLHVLEGDEAPTVKVVFPTLNPFCLVFQMSCCGHSESLQCSAAA